MPRVHQMAPLPLESCSMLLARFRSLPAARKRQFDPGTIVVRDVASSATLLAVEAGAVAVREGPYLGQGAVVDVVGPGDLLGLEGLQPMHRRRWLAGGVWSEARALTRTSVLSVPATDVRRAIASDPRFAQLLVEAMAARAARLEHRLATALGRRVPERAMATLEELARHHGTLIAGGTRIDLPLTQDTLASMVGATRESVNRALRALAGAGSIRWVGRSLLVVGR